jgi:NTP pyrophosphatase (non-canonical NTP hydrolase)
MTPMEDYWVSELEPEEVNMNTGKSRQEILEAVIEGRDVADYNLNDWAQEVGQYCVEKGWREQVEAEPSIDELAIHCANLHGEVSELWEAGRRQKLFALCDKSEEMKSRCIEPLTNLEEELADVIIRALDTAVAFGVNIQAAVALKMAYNKTRPVRHGGKVA